MPTTSVWRREVQYCLELFDSELFVQKRSLFVPSRKIRAITQGEVERINTVSCVELFGSELFGQFHIAVHAL